MPGEAGEAKPRVTVIIPVRESELLRTCLDALEEQDYPKPLLQVVVANNNAVPGIDWISEEFPRVTVVRVPEPGSYRARNRALQEATGEVIAFTDADCRPSSRWVSEAVDAIRSGAAAIGGRVVVQPADPHRMHPIEAYEVVHGLPQAAYVERFGWAVTANMVTSRETFDEVGDFRADLTSGGDAEWGRRLARFGRKMVYAEGAVVYHPARRTYGEYWSKLQRVNEGRRQRELTGDDPRDDRKLVIRSLRPPLGAFARARKSPQLSGVWNRLSYVVGAFYVQYAGVLARYLAVRDSAPADSAGP